MSELIDQALLLQLRQRPRESASSRLAQYLLQQAGRPGPVYGTVGVLATAAQPMLAAWLAKQGEEREREAEREAFHQILNLERQRAQEASAFWRGMMPQQMPAPQPMPETQRPPMSQRSEIIREPLPEPIEAAYARMFDRLAQAESSGNPNAVNQINGRAVGLFQFLPETWLEFARANPRRFEGMTDEEKLAARTDPALSREAAEWYARRNALILGTAGLQPTPTNLALAHRFGGQGAIAILKADPNALVTDVVPDGQRVLEANPDLRGITAGQIIERYRQLVGEPQPQPQSQTQPQTQPQPQTQAQASPAMPASINMLSAQTPQAVPSAPGMAPGIIQPRQMPEAIPGLPQGVTPEMMAQALAHPNPMIRQQAAAFLQVAQALQRQTPNLTSVTPGSFIIDPRTGNVIGQMPQMPGEAERFLSQFIALETQRGTPPEELMRKISDILAQRLRGSSVNVDARQMGNIPPAWRANYDDQGRIVSIEPIPGGPAERDLREAEERRQLQAEIRQLQHKIVTEDIDAALEIIKNSILPAAGAGAGTLAQIGGTPARDVQALLDTIKANIGFNELNRMRQASPTGGALGNVTERELAFLQSVQGSLDQGQTPQQLMRNLNRVKNNLDTILNIMGRVLQGGASGGGVNTSSQTPTQPSAPAQQNTRPPLPDGAIRMEAPPSAR